MNDSERTYFFKASGIVFWVLKLAILFFSIFTSQICASAESEVSARLSVEHPKDGGIIGIKVEFDIPKGIHIYSNDSKEGLPTKIHWSIPDGVKISDGKWPKTVNFDFMGTTAKGYDKNFSVFYEILPPIPSSKFEISAKIDWLACDKLCVPGSAVLKETIAPSNSENKNLDLQNQDGDFGFWGMALAAFLGGAILNLMPCVFPVIGIKILTFVSDAGESRKVALAHACAYSIGIIASFVALGGILILARNAGENLGWGFQLQNPSFAAAMALLFFAMALSFAGVFEIGSGMSNLSATKLGANGNSKKFLAAFSSGVFAVLVASPCTAPFMGTAVGAALSANATFAIAIFSFMGLGMAFPYVLLVAFPPLARALPKPGSWMEIFKQVLSLPLFASAIWLTMVYVEQTGKIGAILSSALLLAAGLRIYGIWGTAVNGKKSRIISAFIAILSIAGALYIAFPSESIASPEKSPDSLENTNAWSAEKVSQLRDSGNIVIADFTASWCLTCQFNKIALESDSVKSAIRSNNVKLLVGDWTNKNKAIRDELKKFGRAGVPLCVVYPADKNASPIVLPAILTPDSIIDAIDKARK